MQVPHQARNDSETAQAGAARTVAQKPGLVDQRPEAAAQRKLVEMMNNSPRVLQQQALGHAVGNSPRMAAQRHKMNTLLAGAVNSQANSVIRSTPAPTGNRAAGESSPVAQLRPARARVTWDTTHVVKEINGSLFGNGDYTANEVAPWGELRLGDVVIVDDEDLFMSRRGANQEDPRRRDADRVKPPATEWIRVLRMQGVDVPTLKLFVRRETIAINGEEESPEDGLHDLNLGGTEVNTLLLIEEIRAKLGHLNNELLVPEDQISPSDLKNNASTFAIKLEAKRSLAQGIADANFPGMYDCLVRFHVKDENVGKVHPGVNSWAYLKHLKGERVAQETDTEALAAKHMDYGHDAESVNGVEVVTDSPFVSTSENVEKLVDADSPFNPNRGLALAASSNQGEQSMLRKFNAPKKNLDAPSMVSKPFSPSIATKKGSQSREPALYVSDKIVNLTHGYPNQVHANIFAPKAPVATHISILLVPKLLTTRPGPGNPKRCCILEAEVVINAPTTDLAQFVVLEIRNQLPQLVKRFTDPQKK
ncbi:hypothetical protein GTP45_09600 [Pseudoduganella sp. FT55W]|uniref:Uncharacterized protein n=1 Tax=Duganella rivi TaxID=2666083 RepID=A0A7X4GR08_9BURK|nr:hypothetical protein [Duganella rivi]MYM67082.1 hypothetical protein [Duganella rivi]